MTYDYNGVGNVGTMWTPDGLGFTYAYNAVNELASVDTPSGPSISMDYDDAGRLSRITRPGSYIDYQYNARNWVTAVLNRTTGGSTLYDARYYYNDGSLWDHVGNPLLRTEDFGSGLWTTTLGYDKAYRLTQETLVDPDSTTISDLGYGYDAVGNRTTRTKDGVTVTCTFDDNDKLTSANDGSSFGYDSAGNMTSVSGPLGSWTLTYDDESRLSSVSYPGGADSFAYNALGQRIRASLDGTVLRYVYSGARVLEETSDAGSVLARYTTGSGSYYGPWLHMWRGEDADRFPLYDAVGTARGLVDGAATVMDSYVLDSFGSPTGAATATVNPYRFGGAWGYITDTPGSGLLQLGQRYYWPELGRFIQQDPIGDGMNWYAYVGNNPITGIDPEGLFARVKYAGAIWEAWRGREHDVGEHVHVTDYRRDMPPKTKIKIPAEGRPVWKPRGRPPVPLNDKEIGDLAGASAKLLAEKGIRLRGITLGVVGGLVTVAAIGNAYAADENDPCANGHPRAASEVGSAAGSFAGSWAGAEIGAAIGTAIVPGAGTIVGGIVGGIAGGLAGSDAGMNAACIVRSMW